MKQSFHDLFHYIGQDQHFRVAIMMLLIYTVLILIAGMLLCFLIWLLVGKLFRYDNYPVSFDDLAHSVNSFRPWKIFRGKKKQVVKSLVALLIFSSLISCQKSNDLALATHTIQYWKDHVPFENSAYECPGDQTWTTDTTLYYNNGLPTKSLVDHLPHKAGKYDTAADGMINRIYFEYLN